MKPGTRFIYHRVEWVVTETHADYVVAESWQRWSATSHSCIKHIKNFPNLLFDMLEILK